MRTRCSTVSPRSSVLRAFSADASKSAARILCRLWMSSAGISSAAAGSFPYLAAPAVRPSEWCFARLHMLNASTVSEGKASASAILHVEWNVHQSPGDDSVMSVPGTVCVMTS